MKYADGVEGLHGAEEFDGEEHDESFVKASAFDLFASSGIGRAEGIDQVEKGALGGIGEKEVTLIAIKVALVCVDDSVKSAS